MRILRDIEAYYAFGGSRYIMTNLRTGQQYPMVNRPDIEEFSDEWSLRTLKTPEENKEIIRFALSFLLANFDSATEDLKVPFTYEDVSEALGES